MVIIVYSKRECILIVIALYCVYLDFSSAVALRLQTVVSRTDVNEYCSSFDVHVIDSLCSMTLDIECLHCNQLRSLLNCVL